MTFTFYNDIGKFKLCGSGNDGFRVCAVSGLEPVELSRSVQTYIGEDGCVENSSQYVQRIITISGDFKINENSKNEIRNAIRVLSRKCTLLIEGKDMSRKIEVNASTFTLGKKYTKFQTFVIQLTCDYPHFSDRAATDGVIFKKEKLLSAKSVLPTMFSKRISTCTINNMGDLRIYPVITITKTDDVVRENEGEYNSQIVKAMETIYDKYGYSVVLSPVIINNSFFNEWKECLPFYKNVATEGVRIVA